MSETKNQGSNADGDKEISLEELSDAFARMLQPPEDAEEAAAASDESPETGQNESPPAPVAFDVTPRGLLEALLFVGHPENEPLTREQAVSVIHGVEPAEIDGFVESLNKEYSAAGHAVEIVSQGTGYRLVLRPHFERVRNRFYGKVREARLSQAAIEVLSLVAYNQPINSQTVTDLRGYPSSSILSQLVRRQLLRIERPQEKPRTPVYYTTDRFLDLFGLEDLTDLPRSQESEP
jgi:segregation and condensation protein B